MTILESKVFVNINNKNLLHYENLNYDIPKENGKVKFGIKILANVYDLPLGSHAKVTKICDMENCNKIIPNQLFYQVIKCRNRGDGKDRCFDCSRSYAGKQAKSKMKYENSLEYFSKENNMEYLLAEFSPKNNKIPSQIAKGTNDTYLWICPKEHEYEMSPKQRTIKDNQNCPYCSNQRILKGYNDLYTTHPNVAGLLMDSNRGYEITYGSKKKEVFVCPDCQYKDFKSIYLVTSRGFSCSRCGDGYSYPEKVLFNILDQLNLHFETQKSFEWSKGVECNGSKIRQNKKYDFYIPSLNMIIETHGEQHYKESFTSFSGRTLQEEQFNDEIKFDLAHNNGIEFYAILDCSKSNIPYIKSSILKHPWFSNLINLSNINWDKCNEYATNSLVKLACEYWNSGIHSTIEIGKLMKLHCGTIANYLKNGTELGWCDYDPKQSQTRALQKCANTNKKKIIQLTLENELVKEWESAADASRYLNINPSGITQTCKGSNESSGGFKWEYKQN